ncbi:Pisatin demethylase [Lachnellula subtilissima]|uniref:Pisatin demethylase n=1 Tax=Lachnellula subtilissima TaxID=602034 RepID=A0A8H8RS96_9HELO|nr:Pisatin demethylase [Lachnellula subtilissima]
MFQPILDLSLVSLFLLLSGFYGTILIIQFILDPLRDIPGPLLARFTRFWYFFAIYKGSFEKTNIALHRKYGPIVRIAPGEYSIDDCEAARTIYGYGNAFVKAPWYSAWVPPSPELQSLFTERDPHRHATQRRKFSAVYSMSSLVGYEPFVNNCSSLLSQRFSEFAKLRETINLHHYLQCFAFDVIGEITFGNRFGFLDTGEDKEGVFAAIDARGVYGTFVGIFPWIHRFLYPLLPNTGGFRYVLNYTLRQMETRSKALKDPLNVSREGPPDIMTKVLLAHEENPQKMTRADLIIICGSNIGAGSDTTAITLSSIFYHLMKNPQSYHRLQSEMDVAASEGRISDFVTFKEAQELPYLQAVIKEALRMHPATGLPLPRVVSPKGATIAGRFIPGNAHVGINPWVASRNTSVFGPDADTWRPERWLEIEEQGRGGQIEKYFFPFGMGSRACIGRNISLLEISKLVPQLLRNFDFVLDESEELRSLNRQMVKQQNFRARIVARSEKS